MSIPQRVRILLITLLFALPARATDPAPRWPLDLPTRYLTSGFMEHRPGRYHAGLDLKTRGETGFAVHAAADGSVVRVRATARAYGRAVYIQTSSGKTYVYAHLSRFNDTLRARIAAARARSGRYRTELYFQPGEIPVRRGDILGLTGQSGTAGPHLHFEVRDAGQHPLNPLQEGFALADTFAPVISSVHAIPMTPDALVAGRRGVMVTGTPGGGALPDTLPLLAIRGPVAFTARMVDHVDVRGYRLAPEFVAVTLDGEEVYRADNSSFAFDQGNRSRLEWYDGFAPRERWLHRRPAVDVVGRSGAVWPAGSGGGGLAPGRHELVVRAADHSGNAARIVLPLLVGEPVAAGEGWRPDSLGVPAGSPEGFLAGVRLNPFFTAGLEARGWTGRDLDPQRDDPVLEPAELWSRPVALSAAARNQALSQDLTPTDLVGFFLSPDLPLAAALQVDFPPGSRTATGLPAQARVFRWKGNRWSDSGGLLDPESSHVGFSLTSPGLYAVCIDTVPPRAVLPEAEDGVVELGPGPARAAAGVTPPRWEVFSVGVREEGSGLAPASIRATLDGKTLVVEPDLPRSRILVELPAATGPGIHAMTLEMADQAGQTSTCSFEVRCRR